jgi:hypothetical protein
MRKITRRRFIAGAGALATAPLLGATKQAKPTGCPTGLYASSTLEVSSLTNCTIAGVST